MRWNFIPNEMFPRKGLMVKAMTEAQRAQAHALLKTGLSQRGYMTATVDHGARERAPRDRGGGAATTDVASRATRSSTTSSSSARRSPRALGLAPRRPSHLAALHRAGRQGGRELPDLLRLQPGAGARRAEEGPARARAEEDAGARPRARADRRAADNGDDPGRDARRDRHRQQAAVPIRRIRPASAPPR